MLKRKTVKIITAILCMVIALSLLATLILPALAQESGEYIEYQTESEAIIELPVGSISDDFAGVELTATIELLGEEDSAAFLETYSGYLPEGYAVDSIYYYAVTAAEDYPEYNAVAGTIISPSLIVNPTVIYLPLSDELLGYKTVGVTAIGMISGITTPETEQVSVGGKSYIRGEYESYGYLALCYGIDENGEPVLLKWYEKGIVGAIYEFLRNFWGLVLLVAIGIIYIIWFFNPNRPAQGKSNPGDPESLPEEQAGVSEQELLAGEEQPGEQQAPGSEGESQA